ncbi:MAG: hypothetical protein IRY94_20955 [Rhodospirillaceae bacterium]|nr:hypothetical protein [Rhodospirillaceae bacterium]
MSGITATGVRAARAGIGAALLAATLGAHAAGAAEDCRHAGGHGLWRYECAGAACALSPVAVPVMDGHGTHTDEAFGFRLDIAPPARIRVSAPAGTVADRLQASANAGVIAETAADGDGGFVFSKPGQVMALVDALEAGQRLLLVFLDKGRGVNTAVAAVGHDGFAATLGEAFGAAETARRAGTGGSCAP